MTIYINKEKNKPNKEKNTKKIKRLQQLLNTMGFTTVKQKEYLQQEINKEKNNQLQNLKYLRLFL